MIAAETLFAAGNLFVLPAWILLAAAPRWRGTQIVASRVAPALIALAYAALVGRHFLMVEGLGDMFSLVGVRQLFSDPYLLLAGWYHYLALDLFVGAWEARDAAAIGLPRWLLVPCLALTLMLGPLGLLCYLIVRAPLRGADKSPHQR